MTNRLPIIALYPGDCTGIGPEQTARIFAQDIGRDVAQRLFIGDSRVLELGKLQAGVEFDTYQVNRPSEIDGDRPGVPVIDLGNTDPALYTPGAADPASGKVNGASLKAIIEFAKTGEIDALTFAPLHKRAMFDGGWPFPDEHRMFANFLGFSGLYSEMNVLDNQWMTRVTSHCSLREAVELVTHDRICDALTLANTTMINAGIAAPRIVVAALNPHSGEGGLFGMEEIEIIRPAVEHMAAQGINCEGPFPSDTVYLKAFRGDYDSVLAMYHDQGQIATKLKGFNKGVTITAGLDIVFTTPAHGTAYDIVGQGIADIGAYEAAIYLAARVASRKLAEKAAA